MSSKSEGKAFVEIDPELCKGCGYCIDACAPEVLKFHDKFNTKGYHYAYYTGEGCTGCGVCYYACPEPEAIVVYKIGYVKEEIP
jgi:2-oxoglutarate ferredoxin oxidoreductase subunit delta